MKNLIYFLCIIFFTSCNDKQEKVTATEKVNDESFCKNCNTLSEAYNGKDSVQGLYLTNLSMSSIDSIEDLSSLNSIKFISSKELDLKVLFPKLAKLKNLKSLSFEDCQIVSIPSEIRLLSSLEEFTIDSDTLKKISNSLYELGSLKKLAYTSNSLDDSIINLINLQDLRVNIIGMITLPNSMTSFSKLQYLMLPHDVLSIPSSISNLRTLKTLNISSTKYEKKIMHSRDDRKVSRYFPDSISNLKKLLPEDCTIVTSGNIKY